jgi:hypothetical protein
MEINGSSEQVDKRWVYDMMEALVLLQSSFSWHTIYSFIAWFFNFCLVYASLEGSLEHVRIKIFKKVETINVEDLWSNFKCGFMVDFEVPSNKSGPNNFFQSHTSK